MHRQLDTLEQNDKQFKKNYKQTKTNHTKKIFKK